MGLLAAVMTSRPSLAADLWNCTLSGLLSYCNDVAASPVTFLARTGAGGRLGGSIDGPPPPVFLHLFSGLIVGIETEARTSDTSSLIALGLALGWIAAKTGWPALGADIENDAHDLFT